MLIGGNGDFDTINIENSGFDTVAFIAVLTAGTSTRARNIALRSSRLKAVNGIRCETFCNVTIDSLVCDNLQPTGGLINPANSAGLKVNLYGQNITLVNHTTGRFIIASSSATCAVYSSGIVLDVGLATIGLATTPGQTCTHSSAVAGRNATNQQGPAILSTNWYALATGAAGVNTLIV
jgi:hypothetical protein